MTFIPMMPALPYMFLMAGIFGLLDGFERFTINNLLVFAGILVVSILVDYFAGVIGAKYGGASRRGISFGFLGLVLGFLLIPPFGGFLGLFLGILISEFVMKGDKTKALKAATGSLIGSISGIFINTLLAIAVFALFITFVFFI